MVDEFVAAAHVVFPGVCIHFEDWKGSDAIRLLARYQDQYLDYNDDIWGTASDTIAGLTTALQIKEEKLVDQTILFTGAGSAGIGIANMLVKAMIDAGLGAAAARDRITLFDVTGLIEAKRDDLNPSQQVYARDLQPTQSLADAVEQIKPTILIGVSTIGGLFTEAVVRKMAKEVERPIIFALSNPTDEAECTPQQAYE